MNQVKYRIENMNFVELKKNAVLPKFQRQLVWSENEKKQFINTLKNGNPFGSILIYKYMDKNKYSIIDGLQRFSTMKDYKDNPQKYVTEIDFYINEILLAVDNDPAKLDINKKNYKKTINDVINEIFSEKGDPSINLANALFYKCQAAIPQIPKDFVILERFSEIQNDLINYVDTYLDIDSITIPCIVFLGDESELADVFENLNRGGRKLNKYQVFAAQWSELELELNQKPHNQQILSIVINRYSSLRENRGIEITDFDERQMNQERKVNLSEFCYALGYLIVKKMSVFWGEKNLSNEDTANEIGYSTLGIVLSVENTKLHQIINKKEFFDDANFLEELVNKIVCEYETINQIFSKYLKHPGNLNKYENKGATNFQLMSYFASLWTIKYTVDIIGKRISINDKYSTNYKKAQSNFINYYLNDLLKSKWSGTGDKSLSDIYMHNSNRYLNTIDKKTLENNLLEWQYEAIERGSINFDTTSKTILTIYSYFYSQKLKSSSYDLEHIVARRKMKDLYKVNQVPAGTLGNMMFLESSYNRSKKEFSLYDSLKDGQKLQEEFLVISEYPSLSTLEKIESDILLNNFSTIKKMIDNRAKAIITNLVNNLYK